MKRVDGHHITITIEDVAWGRPHVRLSCECGDLREQAASFDLYQVNMLAEAHHQKVEQQRMLDAILSRDAARSERMYRAIDGKLVY
jgi:hypothetical protein